MKTIIFSFLLLYSTGLYAQIRNIQINNIILRESDSPDLIKGSPYLFDDWKIGELIGNDGFVHTDIMVNYNLCSDQIVIEENGTLLEVNRQHYKKILLNHTLFTLKLTDLTLNNLKLNHLIPLYTGIKYSLYKNVQCKIYDKTIANLGAEKTVKEFSTNDLYILKLNEEYKLIEDKSTFYNLLGKKRAKELLDESGLKIKKEADLINFIQLLDEKEKE